LEVLVIYTIMQVLESEFTASVEVALGVRGWGLTWDSYATGAGEKCAFWKGESQERGSGGVTDDLSSKSLARIAINM
jgi:hypothetical protein